MQLAERTMDAAFAHTNAIGPVLRVCGAAVQPYSQLDQRRRLPNQSNGIRNHKASWAFMNMTWPHFQSRGPPKSSERVHAGWTVRPEQRRCADENREVRELKPSVNAKPLRIGLCMHVGFKNSVQSAYEEESTIDPQCWYCDIPPLPVEDVEAMAGKRWAEAQCGPPKAALTCRPACKLDDSPGEVSRWHSLS